MRNFARNDSEHVTVEKNALLSTLKENRESHALMYQEAMEVYRKQMIDTLNQLVDTLKAGKDVEHFIRLPIPEEHTDDYDRAIKMYEWHIGNEVTLDSQRFNELVLNEWGWSSSFVSNTASYTLGGAAR